MQIGFGKVNITPRVGVQLSGFGPYINRYSTFVRDTLWARAMAVEHDGTMIVAISNDIIGLTAEMVAEIRSLIAQESGLAPAHILIHCTHSHSGPATVPLEGWGEQDGPYMELLPRRIAQSALTAIDRRRPAELQHAQVPCEGIGINREYDRTEATLDELLCDDWRPEKPELTDTTCHVLTARCGEEIIGFAGYFGCHPVVCCAQTRFIHGDYPGVANNLLEREMPGVVGLFFQGAQGDVNSCVVHKPEQEALLALDVIAGRYARAVREGIRSADSVTVDTVKAISHTPVFSRKKLSLDEMRRRLAEHEAVLHRPEAADDDREVGMATVMARACRNIIKAMERGDDLEKPTEVQGIRLGPVALLGSPFEIFQNIKNDVQKASRAKIPLVMGLCNDLLGYAPDHTAAARGGYAAETVPLILQTLPFDNIHDELVRELLVIDELLFSEA